MLASLAQGWMVLKCLHVALQLTLFTPRCTLLSLIFEATSYVYSIGVHISVSFPCRLYREPSKLPKGLAFKLLEYVTFVQLQSLIFELFDSQQLPLLEKELCEVNIDDPLNICKIIDKYVEVPILKEKSAYRE